MNILYQAKASAVGGRNGHVVSEDGVLDLHLTLPKGLGGTGEAGKTNPEQLFAAGYAACFDSALHFIAGKKKYPLTGSRVDALVGIGAMESGGFGLSVQLNVHLEGLDPEQSHVLLEEAHALCPYSNAVRGNVPVALKVV